MKVAQFVLRVLTFTLLFAPMRAVGEPSNDMTSLASRDLESAVGICSKHRNSYYLSEDQSLFCYDGLIRSDIKKDLVHDLKRRGLFVIRSVGGDVATAIDMANILKDKDATIVLYDYCLSSCANYLFVASSTTFVMKDTIVAWHGGPPKNIAGCITSAQEREERGIKRLVMSSPAGPVCDAVRRSISFFKDRDLDDRHIYFPQTQETTYSFRLIARIDKSRRNVFWMWNPIHHGNYFRGRIHYDGYPESQKKVDKIVSAAHLPVRVIYDSE